MRPFVDQTARCYPKHVSATSSSIISLQVGQETQRIMAGEPVSCLFTIGIFLYAGLLLFVQMLHAEELQFTPDVTQWLEVAVPPESDRGDRMVWFYAASDSKHRWRVFMKDGQPLVQLETNEPEKVEKKPKFIPAAEKFGGGSAFAEVDDGWLVGFNLGEFGAALYCFSHDGEQNYKISDHQIVRFFIRSDGVYALEGLSHLVISKGSMIRIARSDDGAHWQANEVVRFTSQPYAVSPRRDGTMLVTLKDALVSVDSQFNTHVLLADASWNYFRPTSSVLTQNEQKIYIGMRQFVGEVDLTASTLRLLVPSKNFINKLPKEQEERIRKRYGS